MTVRKLLEGKTGFVSVARPEATVQEIIDQLEKDETAAVVICSDGKAIEGIVSNASIVRGVRQFGRNVVDRPVSELMTTAVITCDINEPMRTIYELMDRHQIRHIPITEHGELCGIIHMTDVIKFRLDEIRTEAEALKDYVAGRA